MHINSFLTYFYYKSFDFGLKILMIWPAVRYCHMMSCQCTVEYTGSHFTKENQSTLEVLVYKFFQYLKVIYQVEVLGLIDGLKTGLGAVQSVMVFFNVCQCIR